MEVRDREMKPVEFAEQNCVFAEDQPEYMPLPAHLAADGAVTSCWTLSLRERLKLLFTGRIWWTVLALDQPLQPQLPSVDSPFVDVSDE